jgi:hypothetical protein
LSKGELAFVMADNRSLIGKRPVWLVVMMLVGGIGHMIYSVTIEG